MKGDLALAWITCASSRPSVSGRRRSRITRWKERSDSAARALSPLSARLKRWPICVTTSSTMYWISTSSSMSRISACLLMPAAPDAIRPAGRQRAAQQRLVSGRPCGDVGSRVGMRPLDLQQRGRDPRQAEDLRAAGQFVGTPGDVVVANRGPAAARAGRKSHQFAAKVSAIRRCTGDRPSSRSVGGGGRTPRGWPVPARPRPAAFEQRDEQAGVRRDLPDPFHVRAEQEDGGVAQRRVLAQLAREVHPGAVRQTEIDHENVIGARFGLA